MHFRGREPGLTVVRTDGVGFAAALYVRDRFGLEVATDIPPLTPTVHARPSVVTVAQADWDGWWSAVDLMRDDDVMDALWREQLTALEAP